MRRKKVKEYKLEISAEERNLEKVRDFITKVGGRVGFSMGDINSIKLALDEACSNIIRHAYQGGKGKIQIRIIEEEGVFSIIIADQGRPFDVTKLHTPDLYEYVEAGKKGGLGLWMINKLMDEVVYTPVNGGNQLRLTKFRRKPKELPAVTPLQIKGLSTRLKSIFFAVFLLALIIFGIYGNFYFREERVLTDRILKESFSLIHGLAANSGRYLLEKNDLFLTALVRDVVKNNERLRYALVVDNEGIILADNDVYQIFRKFTPPPNILQVWEKEGVNTQIYLSPQGEKIYDLSLPVTVKGEKLGIIHLGISRSSVDQEISTNRWRMFFMAGGVYIVGIFGFILIVTYLLRPMRKITLGITALGEGRLDHKISVETKDEFGQVAQAFNDMVGKFRLAQSSLVEKERWQKEIQLAQQIQQMLLPTESPELEGYDVGTLYQAAKEVGGDYYDFVSVDDHKLGIVVADVSGKGIGGSLVMSMIRTALRLEARGNKSAGDVLARVNSFITEDLRRGMFVTIFYVILDPLNRQISYASAGHNPMILYRGEEDRTYFLNPQGLPVGLKLSDRNFFTNILTRERIKLKKGDMLVIYTDGITEAMNPRREQYGEERLVQLIKNYGYLDAKSFGQKVNEEIVLFTEGNPQNDDITLVVIKEKLGADEVQYLARKQLFDLVEKKGLSVREACRKVGVSPSFYYKFKRRKEDLGEIGLMSEVSRDSSTLQQLSVEERTKVINIVYEHPEYGPQKISQALNTPRYGYLLLEPRLVYEELHRLNLSNRKQRESFVERYKLTLRRETLIKKSEEPETVSLSEGIPSPIDKEKVVTSDTLSESLLRISAEEGKSLLLPSTDEKGMVKEEKIVTFPEKKEEVGAGITILPAGESTFLEEIEFQEIDVNNRALSGGRTPVSKMEKGGWDKFRRRWEKKIRK